MRRRYHRGPSWTTAVRRGESADGAGDADDPGDDGATVEAIRSVYGPGPERRGQPLTDATVLGAAGAVLLGAWAAWWPVGMSAGIAVAAVVRAVDLDVRRWMLALVVVAGALAGARAGQEHQRMVPADVRPVHTWATVVGDPRPAERVTRLVLRLEGSVGGGPMIDELPAGAQDLGGRRFEVWVRDQAGRDAVDPLRHGDRVLVSGQTRPLAPERADRVAWQHVVGELRLAEIHALGTPSPLDRFSAMVRRAVDRGSARLDAPHDALLRGLVIGDRRGQPTDLVERFRRSGLSHVTVASGLNVALMLTAASPLLTRLRPAPRWLATIALVVWFASLTRFEPSIVRASAMAAIAATAFLLGRDRSPVRLLALAVIVLVLVDPLLVRSLGFRLSVGATWGVAALGPRLARRLPGPGWCTRPLGVTLGAQAGVAAPLLTSIGHVPVVSVPANLLAVPVAALVKLYGLPAAIVAGTVPGLGDVVMAPCRLGVWWVDRVAIIAADLEPGAGWSTLWWFAIVATIGVVAVRPGR